MKWVRCTFCGRLLDADAEACFVVDGSLVVRDMRNVYWFCPKCWPKAEKEMRRDGWKGSVEDGGAVGDS
jgi:ribosomal protein L24E